MRNALLDIAQGASNAAADAVSGPVDLLAWAARKAGVPVGSAPVGGSAWMAAKGLTKQPQNALLGMAGETAGMISPIVAQAKAAEVAKLLLQGGHNLANAQRIPMSSQRGAVVYHGSPHQFDKFDSSKIGTGEGAQAYGHGLYLAESPEVGSQYARMNLTGPANVAHVAGRGGGDALAALKRVYPGMPAQWYESAVRKSAEAGSLYKVDLPDEKIARMLDWDKPLNQQAPGVLKVLQQLAEDGQDYYPTLKGMMQPFEAGNTRGQAIYHAMQREGGSASNATRELRAAGIPGIRYLDGGSRSAGTGSSNYVVFPGEENALVILERNGRPLR
jgi:hypothetical protein